MWQSLFHTGRFMLLIGRLFRNMERIQVYYRNTLQETLTMGVGSLQIIVVASLFIGAVLTLNTAFQLSSGLFPMSIIGTVVSSTSIMEFAPTIMGLLLAGKVGANIASELGTMRVDEQIDALEVMGVNSASFLILPKVVASLIAFPALIIFSAVLLHVGGIIAGVYTEAVSVGDFTAGVRQYYEPFQVTFMLIKSFVFGLTVALLSAYQGYFVSGGPVEVGRASNNAVVISSISILMLDFLLAQFLL